MRNLLLLASLAVNIFILGLFVGDKLSGDNSAVKPPGPRAGGAQFAGSGSFGALTNPNDILPIRALETLPPELRREARRTITNFLPQSRSLKEEIALHRREIADLIRQPELDQEALAAAVQAMQDAQFEQQRLTADTITTVLVNLPDEERVALVKRIEEYRQRQRQQRMQQQMQKRMQQGQGQQRPDQQQEDNQGE